MSVFLPEVELSAREMDLLDLICDDISQAEISNCMGADMHNVVARLIVRVGCRSAVGLAVWWVRSRSALRVEVPVKQLVTVVKAKAVGV
jgi:DNA-binding CsgD family transcriptional regulator